MGILSGLRIVEGSAFVAAPLCGLTLAQMGAEVIRFDRIEGGLDAKRWPVTAAGVSLFWAGLNKGKRSLAVNLADPEGQEIVARLITAPGEGGGIFLTNLPQRGALAFERLRARRPDLIQLTITGDRRGGPQVDYTVNPALGFPEATGTEGTTEPVGHVLPAWDCITGLQAAVALLAAERHRRLTGEGQRIELALKDVGAAMLGHLGILAEALVTDAERPKIGNALYGAYAQDFLCADGVRLMVVGLTPRQWQAILAATGTEAEMAALAARLGADLGEEGERFRHRHAITALLRPVFAARPAAEMEAALEAAGATWSRYRTFRAAAREDPDLTPDNPIFTLLDQPGVGPYPVPGAPQHFSAVPREAPRPAPRLGQDSDALLAALGYSEAEIARLHDRGIVAGPR